MIGPDSSRFVLDRSSTKLQPIATWSPAFSFPALEHFVCFDFKSSLARCDIFLNSDLLLWLGWFWFYNIAQNPVKIILPWTFLSCVSPAFPVSPFVLFEVFLPLFPRPLQPSARGTLEFDDLWQQRML